MTALAAWREGIRRVNRAPVVVLGAWTATLVVAVPLAIGLKTLIAEHLGSSLAADSALSGVNQQWWQEFSDQASGLGATLKPAILGFGAVLGNISGMADGEAQATMAIAAVGVYLLLWQVLSAGAIDRLARDRETRAHGFFAAAGGFLFRFLRLAVIAGIVYGALFRIVRPWLLDSLYGRMTREMTVESTAFFERLVLYLLFACAVAACNLVFDYAKVRAVIEDRRSMLGAVIAGARFVRRNAAATSVAYLLNIVLLLLTIGLYALVAPGAGTGTFLSTWGGLAVGQLYVAARLWVKLAFWASEAALFQSRLAHAGYVAAPATAWPESAAGEAIRA